MGFGGISGIWDRTGKWLRYNVFGRQGGDRILGILGGILEDLRGDFCNMVLLQRGTTWLLGGSMLEKMKIHPYAGIQPKAGLYIVYIMPYILYTLYSLLFGRVRCGRRGCRLVCTDAATL